MEKKSKKKSRRYFGPEHEQAIIDYVSSVNQKERNNLYANIIQPAFLEMVEKIAFKYKFTTLPNIDSLIQECESHLITVLSKFKKERGSKAFSYFSVITKNWFTQKAKKLAEQNKKETQCEEISKAVEVEFLSTENKYIENRITEEFIKSLWNEMEQWQSLPLKSNERKVLEAIKILLSEPDAIENFNKKAVYIYVREITGLNTKQVLNNLNKLRNLYSNFKNKWNNQQ